MSRPFTGFHMLGLTVAFFGVVVGVNVTMATLAIRTFGGTVVDNSYVASQKFNRWLDEAHTQAALDWQVTAVRERGHAVVGLSGVEGARVEATAIHPLGRLPAMRLHFRHRSAGQFRSIDVLPEGRWRLEIRVRQGVRAKDFVVEIPA
ncbi:MULTISPECIES: FixH family protein [unclassified Sphingomonas]|uniref:FixH family protein n=1 Tax=unclassified Sphingomonas TaxID=196159 RepID=UPI0006F42631|nr:MULTISPECIES: FixH family protein [unclassified Sphingomonas]KQX23277.1 hypothetical protein ASD17_02860 [Sphingomonas sp. Root1294]KQY68125.1 hypothetical protein ASD39_05380 [Sphingomonas sp. Root50]KRB91017.1 hypothetical protein ASE22_12175 [Sphingomonas sp. Root720]